MLLLQLRQLKLLHLAAVVLEDLLFEAEQVGLCLALEVRVVVEIGQEHVTFKHVLEPGVQLLLQLFIQLVDLFVIGSALLGGF